MTDLRRWPEVKEIVQGALDLPPEEWARYLDEACGDDVELRQEAEALLAVSSTQADFFDDYKVVPPSMETLTLKEGDELGNFRIIRELGKGGMGAVYLAEDREHGRLVAIKTMPRHSQRALREEKRLLASLRHPNIATLYDSGQTKDGLGYFIMEYVEGEPITSYCERLKLPIRQRLGLFLSVCDAVGYAHRNLVVHRDLKPKNILVTAEGEVKLLDFGIAKLLPSQPVLAPSEARSFTMAFASPEQLEGERTTTATDIYSLGVLLCLLLTGRLPYPVKSAADLPWAIRNLEPEKPSVLVLKDDGALTADGLPASSLDTKSRSLVRQLRGDLDSIVLRALQKDPDLRYESVQSLIGDIRRHLSHRPVSARAGSRLYYIQKFWQRHKWGIVAGLFIFVALVTLSGLLLRENREATRQRDQATDNLERAEQIQSFILDIFKASDPWRNQADSLTARELLDNSRMSLEKGFLDKPTLKADLTAALAQVYYRLGIFETAVELERTVLRLRETALGSEHEEVATTLNDLGVLLNDLGEYQESKAHLTKALQMRRKILGEHHSATATTYNNLGTLAFRMGDLADAEENIRRAIEIREQLPGDYTEVNGNAFNNLAVVLKNADRLEEAEDAARRSVALREQTLPPNHPSVGMSLDILGQILEDRGKIQEAELTFRKAIVIQEVSLGKDHPSLARVLANLGVLYSEMEQPEKAEHYLRHALTIREGNLPEGHPDIASTLHNLAGALREQGKVQEAERLYRRALALRKEAHGDSHTRVAITQALLAILLADNGRPDEAELFAREAHRILSKNVAEDHFLRGVADRTLGRCLASQGRYEEAERLLLKSYDLLLKQRGLQARDTRRNVQYLVDLYLAWGKADSAARYRRLLEKSRLNASSVSTR